MAVMVLSDYWSEKILAERQANGKYVRDEVWDGVTFIMPEADNEHDELIGFFRFVFRLAFGADSGCRIHGPVNVSDRSSKWRQNYRIPDVSVFLPENPAEDRKTHWFGGPDLAIEIVSPDDRSRDKVDFYAKVGTSELLVVDRDPWQLELYRRVDDKLKLISRIRPGDRRKLVSVVVPLEFQLLRGRPRPKVKIIHTEIGQEWVG